MTQSHTTLHKCLELPLISSYFTQKMENKSSSLSHAYMFVCVSTLKRVQTHMEIQHTRQKQSVYSPNEPESQYLV